MATELKEPFDEADRPGIRYAYKASLIGSAHQFELTDNGLSWEIAGRSGVWAYRDISAVRLSYRPTSMQSRRFRADIWHSSAGHITILSTSWQTASLMTPQDDGYRRFIEALHARMAAAGSAANLTGGLPFGTHTAALAVVALLAIAMTGLFARAIATGEHVGALFLVGFALLFYWQIGGFIRRNRPITYTFDRLPEVLLP
ncbi:hypothetical protein [Bradyrhizobium sp.]|uniref:hypothetical protein n=1 Tax=Bradyrhizobium sp. TaxID=376 RepID=UPI0040381FC6